MYREVKTNKIIVEQNKLAKNSWTQKKLEKESDCEERKWGVEWKESEDKEKEGEKEQKGREGFRF